MFRNIIPIWLYTKARKQTKKIEYPPKYIADLHKTSAETRRLRKQGKIKGYTSAQELIGKI